VEIIKTIDILMHKHELEIREKQKKFRRKFFIMFCPISPIRLKTGLFRDQLDKEHFLPLVGASYRM
jgi:hypothetical protein